MISISADILSFGKGAEHFDNIKSIRIVSKTYNLLIMVDYLPLIGEVEGNLTLIGYDGSSVEYKNICGFYRHSRNKFDFILKGTLDND